MDQASLAKLVAEQAKVIEQLKIERDSASQLMKEEILSSLKEDLRPRRRKKKGRRAAVPPNLEESYSDIEVDYYGDKYDGAQDSSLPSSSTSMGGNMIVRSSSTSNMKRSERESAGFSSTTGRKVAKSSSRSLSSYTSTVSQNRSIDALVDSPFNATMTMTAKATSTRAKRGGMMSLKKKSTRYNPNKAIPLSPTTSSLDATATLAEPALDKSTMLFLQKSAMLVNSTTGKDAASVMANTFSKPQPVFKKRTVKKKKQRAKMGDDGDKTSEMGSSSILGSSLESSVVDNAGRATPSRSISFSETTNTPAVETAGLPTLVEKRGVPRSGISTAVSSRSPSRVGTGRISTAGRSSRGGSRPRTVGPSNVATVRSEAESLGRKLLGPLNLDGGTQKAPLPVALQENEWENELARNILSLYSNQVIQEIKIKRDTEAEAGKKKTRKARRIKELKAQGFGDDEIEEIIRTERFSRKSRKIGRSSQATSMSRTGTAKSASMGDTAASVLDGLLRETEGLLEDADATVSSTKASRSRRGTRNTVGSNSTGTVVSTSPSSKDKGGMSGEGKIVAPVRPRMIWFGGTGAIQAEWGALAEFTHNDYLRVELEGLKEKGRYTTYIAMIEGLLAASMRVQADTQTTQLMERLYRQMVVTCIAFGVRSLEQKKYPQSLELLEKANDLAGYEDILAHHVAVELKAFVNDAFAQYYIRRNKPSAALQYITSAIKTHTKRRDYPHVAKCTLHCAYILSKLERHDEAIRCMGQVLALVDDGLLDVTSSNAQSLLLVAVAYHNIAVEQLILRHVSEACVSSQNARRLARLCLSYSNRYLPLFEATHVAALKELAQSVRHKHSDDQHQIFSKLAAGLYS